ncbi:hypothetical protein cyc_03535 [Cyclospora cayetanensis]|uniref:Uncharacterized protein n=1 Tax=Cyclospora cayetanensis TaxID=88456 RepID=A0A1D3CX34_9EIME|nr:hypothetical protein cyc_03535 [Cyclospora cayetanensis]
MELDYAAADEALPTDASSAGGLIEGTNSPSATSPAPPPAHDDLCYVASAAAVTTSAQQHKQQPRHDSCPLRLHAPRPRLGHTITPFNLPMPTAAPQTLPQAEISPLRQHQQPPPHSATFRSSSHTAGNAGGTRNKDDSLWMRSLVRPVMVGGCCASAAAAATQAANPDEPLHRIVENTPEHRIHHAAAPVSAERQCAAVAVFGGRKADGTLANDEKIQGGRLLALHCRFLCVPLPLLAQLYLLEVTQLLSLHVPVCILGELLFLALSTAAAEARAEATIGSGECKATEAPAAAITVPLDAQEGDVGEPGCKENSSCVSSSTITPPLLRWRMPPCVGKRPSPRMGHSLVYADPHLILHGGKDERGQLLSDVWVLDIFDWKCGSQSAAPEGNTAAMVAKGTTNTAAAVQRKPAVALCWVALDFSACSPLRPPGRFLHSCSVFVKTTNDGSCCIVIAGGWTSVVLPRARHYALQRDAEGHWRHSLLPVRVANAADQRFMHASVCAGSTLLLSGGLRVRSSMPPYAETDLLSFSSWHLGCFLLRSLIISSSRNFFSGVAFAAPSIPGLFCCLPLLPYGVFCLAVSSPIVSHDALTHRSACFPHVPMPALVGHQAWQVGGRIFCFGGLKVNDDCGPLNPVSACDVVSFDACSIRFLRAVVVRPCSRPVAAAASSAALSDGGGGAAAAAVTPEEARSSPLQGYADGRLLSDASHTSIATAPAPAQTDVVATRALQEVQSAVVTPRRNRRLAALQAIESFKLLPAAPVASVAGPVAAGRSGAFHPAAAGPAAEATGAPHGGSYPA